MLTTVYLGGERAPFTCEGGSDVHTGMLVTNISTDNRFLAADRNRIDARGGEEMLIPIELGNKAVVRFFEFFEQAYVETEPTGHNCFSFVTRITTGVDTYQNMSAKTMFGLGKNIDEANMVAENGYALLDSSDRGHHGFIQLEHSTTLSALGENEALICMSHSQLSTIYASHGTVTLQDSKGNPLTAL